MAICEILSIKKHYGYILIFNCFILFISMSAKATQQLDTNEWLKTRFASQHEQLIPVVTVADMYFGCQQKKNNESNVTVKALITQLDRNELAAKLIKCLDGQSPKSDIAINYGLTACFNEQLSGLSIQEQQQKMSLVKKSIALLSRKERQKSLTQCVVDQAINYLE